MVGGTSDFSISNLCCAHNTISVGSCNSRNAVPISNANDMVYSNYEVGTVSDFTSHGTLVDGRTLPHFCAPGRALVSAIGTEYQESTGGAVSYETTIDGTTYYWQAMNGTSMASPMAAGIIALWLQADPTLTVNQALAVAEATAQTNFSDITDVRWGAGCIDAFAGLKQILNSGVANVSNADVAFRIDGRRIISTAPVTIHDTMGRRYSQDNELAPGLYIVSTPQGAKKVSIN
jgi:subtilisin family serine protease